MGPVGRTLTLTLVGLVSGLVMVGAMVLSVRDTASVAQTAASRAIPAQIALRRTWTAKTVGQEYFAVAAQATDPLTRTDALTRAQTAGRAQDAAWSQYLHHTIAAPGERALQRRYRTAAAASVQQAASLLGTSPSDPTFAATLAAEREASVAAATALTDLQSKIYEPVIRRGAARVVSGLDDARTVMCVAYAVLALVGTLIGLTLMRRAHADHRRMLADAAAMTAEADHTSLETSLQRALEMETTEAATYDVIRQALTIVEPDVPSELLLADSGHGHFRQVLTTGRAADSACRVSSPDNCPATMSGLTQQFASSAALDTCPYLRGRDDEVWATCVPVGVAGRSTGVLHMQRSVDLPATDATRRWELVARKAGDRLGMLRAFARSETQAHTDPLTGLLNRRSLEARVRDLTDEDLQYVVAYGDLDHFKLLNDVHGHDTGDRALRLFARVLRDSVRPDDIPARYGGEEFVAVLPDCSLANASVVIERVRSRLAQELADGGLPAFTVSFGLAASRDGAAFGRVVELADHALLRAKRDGRDRVAFADARGNPVVDPSTLQRSPSRPARRRPLTRPARRGDTVRRCRPRSSPDAPPASDSPPPSGSPARDAGCTPPCGRRHRARLSSRRPAARPLSLLVLDVDDDTSVADGIASVIQAEGRVDILVNNAGVVVGSDIERTPVATFQSVMNTNTWGTLRCIQAVLPTMREQGSGCIVNVTSIAGRVASRRPRRAYAASKWAAEAISETLAPRWHRSASGSRSSSPAWWRRRSSTSRWSNPSTWSRRTSPYTFRTSRFLLASFADPSSGRRRRRGRSGARSPPTRRPCDIRWAPTASRCRSSALGCPTRSGSSTMSDPDDAVFRARMLEWSGVEVPPL